MSKKLKINGKVMDCESPTIPAIVASLTMNDQMVAVMVNGAHVPRKKWPEFVLHQGDDIDVVVAITGG